MSDNRARDNSDGLGLAPGQTVGIIAGIAAGVALIAICLLVGMMLCRRWYYKRSRSRAYLSDLSHSTTRGQVAKGGQEVLEQISFNTDGEMLATATDKGASPVHETKASYTEEDVRSQKRRTKLGSREFPRGDLLLTDYIGEGDYGPIYKGEAYGLGIKEQQRPVTVKMLTPEAPEATRIRFEQDIALMSSINHLNVVGMLAVCTEESPECILLDAGKDLHTFIREKKAALVEEQPSDSIQSLAQQSLELLKIADEICLGMAYLASQHFIHKDLALRNCIIGYDGVSKVALFGLGPKTHPFAYYKTHGNDLPIRWMAPETISTAPFTTENDQWAFGVLMWELFTYGELPYANKTNEEVIKFVAKDFGRLPKPEKCIEDIYLVMSSCWELETGSRPTFLVLHENLFDLIGEIQQKL